MKKPIIFNLFLMLFVMEAFSQTTFLGFEQKQCGLVENHGYTFANEQGLCSTHSAVYKIFFNEELVYEKPCIYLGFYSVIALSFINDSTGFLIEGSSGNCGVYKTNDYGKSWDNLGSGGPDFLGYYVVNEHDVYLITTANGWGAMITKASAINGKGTYDYHTEIDIVENEAIINDTIYGAIFCEIDTLSFKVKDGADTITYNIAFHNESLPTGSRYLSDSRLTLYPNPCSDYIYFAQNRFRNKQAKTAIYTMDGRLVKFYVTSGNRIYVGDLKTGVYLMEIEIGDEKVKRKIIKI
jgi:hypothetical protein